MKLKISVENKTIACICLSVPLIMWLYVVFHPQSSFYGYGGGDNVLHFQIARYSFNHPELFFYHWGKPVFTILGSPFAQIGFRGLCFFNLLVSVATCWIAWLSARRLQLEASALVIIFTAFSPVFFFSATSTLTEPLFSLFAITTALLFLQRKYIAAAVVFSFTIFIRTESFVLFPLVIAAFMLVRQWKAIPFLFSGFILISLAGYPFYGNFFWFFSEMPYNMGHSIYGSGSLFHFVKNYKEVFGLPLFMFICIGIFVIIGIFLRKETYRDKEKIASLLLIAGIPFVFFAAHSWVWYKGTGGSLGLLRVIACVSPFFAITGLYGYRAFTSWIDKFNTKLNTYIFAATIITSVLFISLYHPGYIFRPESAEQLIEQTTKFLRREGLDKQRIFYFNPLVAMYLDKDPWSTGMKSMTGGLSELNLMEPGDVYVWDAHFGPNEGKSPLDSLLARTDLELIMMLLPNKLYDEKGQMKYAVYTFRKLEPGKTSDNYALASDPKFFITKLFSFTKHLYHSDDIHTTLPSVSSFTDENINDSDHYQLCFTEVPEFYSFIDTSLFHLAGGKEEFTLFFECEAMISDVEGVNSYVVFTAEEGKRFHYYEAVPFRFSDMKQNTWEQVFAMASISIKCADATNFKCYIWNRSQPGSGFCLRNVRISEMTRN
jgi:hypothetical protein